VLSHLLLNDAIKLKAAVVAVARSLADDGRRRVQQAARLFFSQLAAKSRSPVYNLLPQLISSLSQPSSGLSQQQTRAVLSFLLSFISKDRQTESIVQRLCQRLASDAAEADREDDAAAGEGAEAASAQPASVTLTA
jgi:condensin complex subunit 1